MRIDNLINLRDNILRYAIKNPDVMGEMYRDLTFDQDANGELGCYTTFELRDGWEKVESTLCLYYRTLLCGCWAKTLFCESNIHAYKNPKYNVLVAWIWDGDGSLLFSDNNLDKIYINTDCKKTYDWQEAPEIDVNKYEKEGWYEE